MLFKVAFCYRNAFSFPRYFRMGTFFSSPKYDSALEEEKKAEDE
jgi:hypothetical protein